MRRVGVEGTVAFVPELAVPLGRALNVRYGIAADLVRAGYCTVDSVLGASDRELLRVMGVGQSVVDSIRTGEPLGPGWTWVDPQWVGDWGL